MGHGTNIEDESKKNTGHSVIVSRSHAGDVEEKAAQAFGKNKNVISAGGAGRFFASDFRIDILRDGNYRVLDQMRVHVNKVANLMPLLANRLCDRVFAVVCVALSFVKYLRIT